MFPHLVVRPSTLLRELPNLGSATDKAWQRVFADGKRRGEQAFKAYVRPTRQQRRIELLVCHGNLIRYFTCRVLGVAPESWASLGTSHGGITQLCIRADGHVQVVSYNDTGHLPTRLRS